MKLDLMNSRIQYSRGHRVFDSVEDGEPKKISDRSISAFPTCAFRSKQKRIAYDDTPIFSPPILERAVVDRKGNYVHMSNLVSHPNSADVTSTESILNRRQQQKIEEEKQHKMLVKKIITQEAFHSPILEKMKEKIHDTDHTTFARIVNSGKLPGAIWPTVQRFPHIHSAPHLGPACYDTTSHERGRYGIPRKCTKFSAVPVDRGELKAEIPIIDRDLSFAPFPVRKRQERMRLEASRPIARPRTHSNSLRNSGTGPVGAGFAHSSIESPLSQTYSPNSKGTIDDGSLLSSVAPGVGGVGSWKGSIARRGSMDSVGAGSVSSSALEPRSTKGVIKFDKAKRFDSPFYKQESYTKTTGMRLPPDYDRKLANTRIGFRMRKEEALAKAAREKKASRTVELSDVDAGRLFSMAHFVSRSPVKYSASFKSSAKVGMEIAVPTSGTEIGPGSFAAGTNRTTVHVKDPHKPSYTFLRDRKFDVKRAAPDPMLPIKKFAEVHTKGATIAKHGKHSGNVVLKRRVKQKMAQIYPKLAEKHFPYSLD